MKLSELLSEWLYENHKDEIKPRTLLKYECSIYNYILPYFKDEEIESLTPRTIQHWITIFKELKGPRTNQNLSNSSINNIIAILKLAFNYAVDFEIIPSSPLTRIKRVNKKENNTIKAFTRDEQIKIENYIERLNNREYFCYILVLYTGLRLGELLALTWKDINLKTGIMTINKTIYKTKNDNGEWYYMTDTPKSKNSNREIPLPPFIKEMIRQYKKEKKSTYVVAKEDGSRINDKLIVYRYKMLLKRSRVRYLNFHCLRHTFATRALENNMDIKTLSEILGHASASTTLNIYTHSLINHKRAQMRKIKRLI